MSLLPTVKQPKPKKVYSHDRAEAEAIVELLRSKARCSNLNAEQRKTLADQWQEKIDKAWPPKEETAATE